MVYLVSQVTITPKISVAVDLPADFSLFKVSSYSGLNISLSAGTITKATLTTSPAIGAAASIAAGMQVACLRFDAVANTYTYIDGATYNADKTMTVNLPKAGFYSFVSASFTIPIPTLYAEVRATLSTSVKTISYAGGELTLGVQTTSNTTVKCTKKSSSTTEDPAHKRSIGAFFDIELETEEKVKKGEIKYKYDSTAVVAVRTILSHSIYTRASEHTYTHTFSLFLSPSLSRTHTSMHTCTPSTWYVHCTLPQLFRMQIRVCGTRTYTHAHLLVRVHTWSQGVVPR